MNFAISNREIHAIDLQISDKAAAAIIKVKKLVRAKVEYLLNTRTAAIHFVPVIYEWTPASGNVFSESKIIVFGICPHTHLH